jgi:predicted 2-oxoglutarate/Fe(II)-dependent dioxygenase YbiX
MFVCKGVLTKEEVKSILEAVESEDWDKGVTNADDTHKNNKELVLQEQSQFIANKITAHPLVHKYGLINQMVLPRLNSYGKGHHYASHVDFFKQQGIRTDWSMTLFLTEPDTYEGGELVIEDLAHEPLEFKLDAGDMVFYPSGLIHRVNPVTKGVRTAAISWAQSEVEDFRDRNLLGKLVDVIFDLDANRELNKESITKLSAVHNALLRKWGK